LAGDRLPGFLSRLDLAGGIVWKEIEDELAPDQLLQDMQGGSGHARSHDLGLQVGYRIIDSRGRDRSPLADFGGMMLAVSAGLSTLNAGDDGIVHIDADQSDPLPKMHVQGWALRFETGLPPDWRTAFRTSGHAWLGDALVPLFSFTYTRQRIEPGILWDEELDEYVYERDSCDCNAETGWGWEIGLANVFHLRRGHLDGTGLIEGDTRGWGLHLPFGRWGGLRYDQATVPQAPGLVDVTRESAGFWIDVFALLDQE